LAALALLVSGCAKDVITGKTTLNYYKVESEPKLGMQVLLMQEKALKKEKKEVDSEKDKVELEMLRKIVADIAAVSHYPQFPYEVHLADVDIVNAWCAPGGKIMVYEGLWDPKKGLVEKGNEDQLAAVLAQRDRPCECAPCDGGDKQKYDDHDGRCCSFNCDLRRRISGGEQSLRRNFHRRHEYFCPELFPEV